MSPFLKKRYILFFLTPILSGLIFYLFFLNSFEIKAQTNATTSLSVVISVCGNGIIDVGEQCDGSNLNGQSCIGLGYNGGSLSCNTDCTFKTSGCTSAPPGGGGGGVMPPSETKIVLLGKASPLAKLTILKDGEIFALIDSDINSNFRKELTNLNAGIYSFGIWSEDQDGKKSITVNFTVTVTSGIITTISEIFIPPTIAFKKNNLKKGEILNISGRTVPDSEIKIYVEKNETVVIKKTTSDKEGKWQYSLDTSEFEEGFYSIKVIVLSGKGIESNFSDLLKFGIAELLMEEPCPGADLNRDGKVNLIDFSILLYWWEKYSPCVDQNQDGTVNLPDFSIMMYYWNG